MDEPLGMDKMHRARCKKIPFFAFVLLTAVYVVSLAGCGPSMKTFRFYQGPELPHNETAQLVCKGETTQLNSVNGQKSPTGKVTFGQVTLEMLPGDYTLTVSFSGRSMTMASGGLYYYNIFYRHASIEDINMTLKAEAGHTYLITSDHNYGNNYWYAVIRNETDGTTILRKGPYPLTKIRTGDNQASRRKYRQ